MQPYFAVQESVETRQEHDYLAETKQEPQPTEKPRQQPVIASGNELKAFLSKVAVTYGLDYIKLEKTIMGESGFQVAPKDNGISIGVAQFTAPTWFDYCRGFGKYEDRNPIAQLNCMGYMWSIGLEYRWDAYCNLYYDTKCIEIRGLYPGFLN